MPVIKRKATDQDVYDNAKRTCSRQEDSSPTLSEDEMSNDLLFASGKTADETYSQYAKVYHKIESSQKSKHSTVFTPVSTLCKPIGEDEAFPDGSTTRRLEKSPTYYSLGKRSPSLYDLFVSQKPVEPSPNIFVDEDAARSSTLGEPRVSDPSDSDEDSSYGQFVKFFEGLGL